MHRRSTHTTPLRIAGALGLAACLALPLASVADVARGSGMGALSMQAASNQNEGDWEYSVRPDDTLSGVADRLLKRDRDADDLMSYNQISAREGISSGDTLQIPMQWLRQQPEPAVTLSVTGDAYMRPHLESSARRLQAEQELNVGDEVRTDNGRALIELADDSLLRMDSNSRLTFNRLTQFGKTGMADTRMELERGRVRSEVAPVEEDRSRFEIETPSAVAAVRGTVFDLEIRDDTTHLAVYEGGVHFGDDSDQQLIPSGYSASKQEGQPVDVEPLDPAPSIATESGRVSALPFEVSWEDETSADRYRVDLIRRDTNDWLVSQEVDSRDIKLANLDNGEYRLKVAALGSDGFESQPDTLDFVIGLRAYPANLAAPEADATIEEDTPKFEWSLQGEEEEARVEIARDDDFDEPVATSEWDHDESAVVTAPLEPGEYYWRVVTRAGGSATATSDSSPFTVTGTLPETRIISANAVGEQVNLYWNSLDEAERYEFQLARDESFEEVVEEDTVEDTDVRLQLQPGETYHIRVRGVAEPPLTSDWGSSHEMTLE